MNHPRRSLFTVLLCALVLVGCSSPGGGPDTSEADLQGLITGAGGAPVAGASVTLHPAGESSAPGTLRTTSNHSGAYSFSSAAAGTYNLVVTTSDGLGAFRANVTVTGTSTATLNVQVAPLGAIRGVAILEGRPSDSAGIDVFIPGTDFTAETASNGSFLMSGVPAGAYELHAEASQHDPETVTGVNVTAGATTVLPATITLQPDDRAPTAAFTAELFGNVLRVDASASTAPEGDIVSYEWNFGDGTTGAGVTAQHAYSGTGTRTVTLTVTDVAGRTGTETMQVTVEGVVQQLTANTDAQAALTNTTLAAGDTAYYEIAVSSTVADAGAVLYVELSEDLSLEVDWFGDVYYSESSAYFSVEPLGPEGTQVLTPSGVDVLVTCRGSCVIVESGASTARVSVTNSTGASLSFNLFAFTDALQDTNEPTNDTLAGAAPIGGGESDSGALELIGDVDYYRATADGQVTFDGPTSIDAVATVRNAADVVVDGPYAPGESFVVVAGEYIRIEAAAPVAAAAADSAYSLTLD